MCDAGRVRTTDWERDAIRGYFETQSPEDAIEHLEKVAVERVAGVLYEIWDVHTASGRWWAVTNPLNAYSQEDFKSRDVVLTFDVGLAIRIASRDQVPITAGAAALLPGAWRRWEQAVEALTTAREAEDFQAVGVRLRECLVSFAAEIADDDLLPAGTDAPKRADVVGWTNLLANTLAAGASAARLRSYLKKLTRESWDYVNWLTHAKNARNYDAEIGTAAVSHLLATITAARLRWTQHGAARCDECGSYSMAGGQCQRCGSTDPGYTTPSLPQPTDEELAARLASRAVHPQLGQRHLHHRRRRGAQAALVGRLETSRQQALYARSPTPSRSAPGRSSGAGTVITPARVGSQRRRRSKRGDSRPSD
jgi:hypothetical protein